MQQLMAAARANAEVPMCDECGKIDKKIEHYRNLVARLPDPLTHERLAELVAELEAKKTALHPEQEK
jgi:hypothetical protein